MANKIKNVDSSVIDMAKSVKSGTMTIDDFKSKTIDATNTTSKFGAGLKSIGGTILSTAGNMVAGALIAEAISLAIKGIYNIVKADEIAIEKGEEASQAIKETLLPSMTAVITFPSFIDLFRKQSKSNNRCYSLTRPDFSNICGITCRTFRNI